MLKNHVDHSCQNPSPWLIYLCICDVDDIACDCHNYKPVVPTKEKKRMAMARCFHRINMSQSSGDKKESNFQDPNRVPAEQFGTLATTFRRRLLVGIGSASLIAVGADFGGVTSFLLGLSPETSRNLKLDVIYPIGGYTRCIDTNQGFGQ